MGADPVQAVATGRSHAKPLEECGGHLLFLKIDDPDFLTIQFDYGVFIPKQVNVAGMDAEFWKI